MAQFGLSGAGICAPCSGLGVHKVNHPSRGRHADRTRSLIRFSGKFVL